MASTPGYALQIDRGPIAVAANATSAILNGPGLVLVPAAPSTLPDPEPQVTAPEDAPTLVDAPGYATLSAAVAAQEIPSARSDELECLAGAVYYESKGEPLAGQLAVADVIINRTHSGRFPQSICSVISQRGQFSFVRGGRIPAAPDGRAYRTAVAVAQVAMNAVWESPAPKAMYFHARRVSPNWQRIQVASIGNHIFYR